jgi:SAM-dependent methyltransferase
MRCLILGNAKNGTTALFHAVAQCLPGATRYFEEPLAALGNAPQATIAKLIFENVEPEPVRRASAAFDKRVGIIRDPRDNLVSRALYSAALPIVAADSALLSRLVDLIDAKQRDPEAVDFVDILRILTPPDSTFEHFLERNLQRHNRFCEFVTTAKPSWFVMAYEKFVRGQMDELSDYLGMTVNTNYEVAPTYQRVVRTKAAGDWRNWFTANDVTFLRPWFEQVLTASPYVSDWTVNDAPIIEAAHSTLYVRRIIRERRAKLGLPDFDPEMPCSPKAIPVERGTEMNVVACNLCGGTEFSPGPAGRLANTGVPPHCQQCGSLERQRILRRVFQALPLGFLDWRRGLQFSPDQGLDPQWFRHYEVSVYGGPNSLDMQAIARPDASIDFVSFNHVLEFIPDDRAAFAEIVRILAPRGILQACFSAPLSRPSSQDYDRPFGPHAAWHLYGMDLGQRFQCKERGLTLVAVEETDPCTGVREVVHLFCKDPVDASRLREWLPAWSDTIKILGK